MDFLKRNARNERIRELSRKGWTYQMIAEKLELSTTTVWRALKNKNQKTVKI